MKTETAKDRERMIFKLGFEAGQLGLNLSDVADLGGAPPPRKGPQSVQAHEAAQGNHGSPRKYRLSPATRARMAVAQRRRWKAAQKGKKTA